MPAASTPADEAARLQTLHQCRVLDTAPSPYFDGLTDLARDLFGASIALISLVDEQRLWFKSSTGLDVPEVPRIQSLCDYAIQNRDTLVVADAADDPRFASAPLVTGAPNIRFYAGAVLEMSNGSRIGTLCVIDQRPQQPGAALIGKLEILRSAVVTQLEFDLLQHQAGASVLKCAWCDRIHVSGDARGIWIPAADYLERVGVTSHGICGDCQQSMSD